MMRLCHRHLLMILTLLALPLLYLLIQSNFIQQHEETTDRSEAKPTFDENSWMLSQRQRRRILASHCPSGSNLTLDHLLTRPLTNGYDLLDLTIVDDTHKLIYCYVPKVATTNWKRVFLILTGKADDPKQINRYNPHNMKQFRTLRQYTRQEQIERINTYTKFLFVRHPHRRLVSGYYDRLRYDPAVRVDNFQEIIGTEIIRRYRPANETSDESRKLGHDVKFSELIQFLTDRSNPGRLNNIHFRPIVDLCYPCQMNYTFIGKYEHLIEDANMILQQVNVSLPFAFPSSTNKNSKTIQRFVADLRSLNDEQRAALYEEFKSDFQLFDYDPDDWLDY